MASGTARRQSLCNIGWELGDSETSIKPIRTSVVFLMSQSHEAETQSQAVGSQKDPVIIDDIESVHHACDGRLTPIVQIEVQSNTATSNVSPNSQIRSIRAESKRRWEQSTQTTSRTVDAKSNPVQKKKPKMEADQQHQEEYSVEHTSAVPIKIFTSELPVASPRISPHVKMHCRSLRELIGLEGCEMKQCQIQWMVIFNYLIDFEHLLDTVPELVSIANMAVFYGHGEPQSWKQMNPGIHFQQLLPSDAPNSPTNPLGFKVPWGVHHTKMFLIGFADGTLRVIIHTSNLLQGDVSLKTQAAYVQDFPLKTTTGVASKSGCGFENDFIAYLQSYKYIEKREWSDGGGTELARSLCDEVRRYEFSSAKVVLIPSTPGRGRLDEPKGYLKLAEAIRKNVPKRAIAMPIICQFSSIGSLTAKWLQDLTCAWDASQSDGMSAQDVQRLLKLVYPTVEEIRVSVEGYSGGGSVPGRRSNTSKPFLQPLYHKWSSSPDSLNPLHKPKNVPHIKTFYQISQDGAGMEWFCLTSHNLSKAAWGEIINTNEGRRIFTRHWELGVFVSPGLFGKEKLVPAGADRSDDKNQIEVPLPFKLNPSRYGLTDHPWTVDATYSNPDRFGRNGCV